MRLPPTLMKIVRESPLKTRAPATKMLRKMQTDEASIEASFTKLQARQGTVKTIHDPLKSLPEQGTFLDDVASAPEHKATIKVSAKDVTSSASTDLATVVLTWQGSNFGLSSGILLSVLPNRTYANTPIIVNGVPVLDSGGKVTTMVTETDTKPSVMTPLAMFNYELPGVFCCKGKFGVLLSAGLGANLSTKSADYMAGVSFRYREVLFTPALHYGRENFLTNGIAVGQSWVAVHLRCRHRRTTNLHLGLLSPIAFPSHSPLACFSGSCSSRLWQYVIKPRLC